MSKSNAEKIEPYAAMLGELPDAKIAEMAGVTEAAVAKYRERAATQRVEPEAKPAAEAAPKAEKPAPKAEAAPAYDDNARSTALAEAAEALLEQGWRFVDGQLVPPVAGRSSKEPELVVRLKAGVRLKGHAANGKPVSIPLARSLYRGAMARRVIELVGEDSGLIERVEA